MRHLLLPALLILGLTAHLAFKLVSADDFVFDPVKTLDQYRAQAIVAEEVQRTLEITPMLPIAPPYSESTVEYSTVGSWGY